VFERLLRGSGELSEVEVRSGRGVGKGGSQLDGHEEVLFGRKKKEIDTALLVSIKEEEDAPPSPPAPRPTPTRWFPESPTHP
jgi:hypothetical protein